MAKTLDFVFDFGSPNAYFAYKALPDILERTGSSLNLIPCLLGGIFKATGNTSPMVAFSNVKGKLDYERLEVNRFIKKHGIKDFKFNPHFPVNTLMMMRGAIIAEQDNKLAKYVDLCMRSVWENELKMDDPEVFASTLNNAGFDGDNILQQSQENTSVKAQLAENTESVVARGAFGVPTFYIGDEMFFGKDRLQQVEEELTS